MSSESNVSSHIYDQNSHSGSVTEGNQNDVVKVRIDPKNGKKKYIEYKMRWTVNDQRSYIDKYVDKFFLIQNEKKA